MHTESLRYINEKYSNIFGEGGPNGKFKKSGLSDFGYKLWVYDVAKSGIVGNLDKVHNMDVWDFIECLSYLRCENKYYELLNKK